MKAHVTVLDPQKAYKEVIENADLTEVSMYLAYRYFVMQMMEELDILHKGKGWCMLRLLVLARCQTDSDFSGSKVCAERFASFPYVVQQPFHRIAAPYVLLLWCGYGTRLSARFRLERRG